MSEAVDMFGTLVESEEEEFVTYRTFARALMRFAMKILDAAPMYVSVDTEAQMVEVLFAVAAKIRLQPDILPIWYSGQSRFDTADGTGREQKTFVGLTRKDDFPLCYLFIDRVHHEGRIGDFARTGLLYIFEAASRSKELEEWIMASDLPTLMASGLGALYSQLSRELSLRQDPDRLPLLLALSDYVEMHKDTGVESAFSDSHTIHTSTFLSDLTFWQDILEHCQSEDVKQTLLDHFQILFLQQLLYPSLLQSSDTDGGSSVAVLTYLTDMLQTLSHADLVRMMLNYLLAVQDKPSSSSQPPSPSVTRRRSFLLDMTSATPEEDRVEPVLFNLVDLIQTGMSSKNAQTTFAALKLYATLSTRHGAYALGTVVRGATVVTDPEQASKRTVGGLAAEMQNLLALALAVGGSQGLDDAFTTACSDVRSLLELQMVEPDDPSSLAQPDVIMNEEKDVPSIAIYYLDLDDPCLTAMVVLLQGFFANSVETNLALTEAILGLAVCRRVRLDGWLARVPAANRHGDDSSENNEHMNHLPSLAMDEDERAAFASFEQAHAIPVLDRGSEPKLTAAFRSLEDQVNTLRNLHSRFDFLLDKRKAIFRNHEKSDADAIEDMGNRLTSPPSTPRKLRHVRQASIASSRTISPSRSSMAARAQSVSGFSPNKTASPTASVTSRRRSFLSPRRLSASFFRPPPAEPSSSPPRKAETIDERSTHTDSEAELLRQRIRFPLDHPVAASGIHKSGSGEQSADDDDDEENKNEVKEVSLSHVLTNVVILQNFIVELVAVMQLRAFMFQEVEFG